MVDIIHGQHDPEPMLPSNAEPLPFLEGAACTEGLSDGCIQKLEISKKNRISNFSVVQISPTP